ncbi:two-component regulator propeller domain-containing protein [Calditrichota bacterium]
MHQSLHVKIFSLLLVWILSSSSLVLKSTASEYSIYTYPEAALPDIGAVNSIFRDSKGFLWLGGDRGAAYYDGRIFHRISIIDGLSDNYTYRIKETPQGEIWICTWNGINKYDIKTSSVDLLSRFSTDPIRNFYFMDSEILIATSGGAFLYDINGRYDIELFEDSPAVHIPRSVNDIRYDTTRGLVWIATEDIGVIAIKLKEYSKLWTMKDKALQAEYNYQGSELFLKKHPKLFDTSYHLSNMGISLSAFEIDDPAEREAIILSNTIKHFQASGGIRQHVFSVQLDNEGIVSAETPSGIFRFNESEFVKETSLSSIFGEMELYRIDERGNYLFAGEKGLRRISGGDTLLLTTSNGLPEKSVVSACFDEQNITWIATASGKLHKIVDTDLILYDAATQPMLGDIYVSLKLTNGNILIGGESGIMLFTKNGMKPFHFQPPTNDAVLGLATDKNNDLIITTNRSIYSSKNDKTAALASNLDIVYDRAEFLMDADNLLWIVLGMKVFTWDGAELIEKLELEEHIHLSIFSTLGLDGSRIFGTWREIIKMTEDSLFSYTDKTNFGTALDHTDNGMIQLRGFEEPRVHDYVITCGAMDADSTYWFGTFGGGIICLKGDSLFIPDKPTSIIPMHFNNSFASPDGSIYFLGDEGVNIMRNGKVENVDFQLDNIPEFNDMLIDKESRIIYATSSGIIIIDGEKEIILDHYSGLKSENITKILHTSENKYMFLHANGIIILDLEQLLQKPEKNYPLLVNRFYANGRLKDFGSKTVLSKSQRSVRLDFGLNDFNNELLNRYSWYLEGLESNYLPYSSSQFVNYQRLPAGSYKFHLKAIDSKGAVHSLENPLEFKIPEYFHETAMFQVILSLLLGILIYLVVIWRISAVRRRNVVLELKVKERTSQLEEAVNNIKTLRGFIPICANCKKIRDDEGFWQQLEHYISEHSEAEFSHGICPECKKELYPEFGSDNF